MGIGTTGSITKDDQVTRDESIEEVGKNGYSRSNTRPIRHYLALEIPQFGMSPIMNGPTPNGVEVPVDTYQQQHHHTQSIMSPVEIDRAKHTDEDWAVKDFGSGLVMPVGAVSQCARRERRDCEGNMSAARENKLREKERENENGIITGGINGNGTGDSWSEKGNPQERSPYTPRGKRGGFFGSHNNVLTEGTLMVRGEDEDGEGEDGALGEGFSVAAHRRLVTLLSSSTSSLSLPTMWAMGWWYGDGYYHMQGHMYPPLPPPQPQYFDTGYDGYQNGIMQPHQQHQDPSMHGLPPPLPMGSAPVQPHSPNAPPLPTPLTAITFPLDTTRWYLLGQLDII